jgi:hypothetical protein
MSKIIELMEESKSLNSTTVVPAWKCSILVYTSIYVFTGVYIVAVGLCDFWDF